MVSFEPVFSSACQTIMVNLTSQLSVCGNLQKAICLSRQDETIYRLESNEQLCTSAKTHKQATVILILSINTHLNSELLHR